MKPTSFNELNTEMQRLCDAGHESDALDLLTRSEPLFPGQAALTRMLRVELLARMNRASEAVDLLRDGLDRGYRYRGRWLRHERIALLTSHPGFFVWNDRDRAARDLETHLATLRARLSLDATRSVLGGFSMGARLAVELGLRGHFLTKRILAVGTWLPDFEMLRVGLDRSSVQDRKSVV